MKRKRIKRIKKRSKSSSDESSVGGDTKKPKGNSSLKSKLDVYSRGNHIIFKGDINKDNIYQLGEEINQINKTFKDLEKSLENIIISSKPIYLHLNTYGGYLDDAFAGIDFIKNSKIPVYTIVEGRCASAGTLLSVVGKKRYMAKHSKMLIHQLRSGLWGKMDELEDAMDDCQESMEDILDIYLEYTNMKKTAIKQHLKKDRWWNFSTCKKNGMVDLEWKNDD